MNWSSPAISSWSRPSSHSCGDQAQIILCVMTWIFTPMSRRCCVRDMQQPDGRTPSRLLRPARTWLLSLRSSFAA